ncbi:glutathione S-transferase family protein [Acidovorax sp. DW039]|uniref:glutathione S-transferase n=1 Tax=Acidovorax sp. DW039 TaxID=3095606 RepID=UPI0030861703|nr:glutathione S-transferase family protein [Acidovorax sp. DW039]
MQLIGMLDSPYVRRVAVALHALDITFEHQPVSVFRQFDDFARTNPIVKAPTLVTDEGVVLMDSTLILQWIERCALRSGNTGRSLISSASADQLHDLRLTGLALAACEKTVQTVYEQQLRPAEKQHAPWLERVERQRNSAFELLEAELQRVPMQADTEPLTHGRIACAVAWSFTQLLIPGCVPESKHPALAAYSAAAEQLPAFVACPQA